ncbi:hypothetical protein [Erwinia amylovora]
MCIRDRLSSCPRRMRSTVLTISVSYTHLDVYKRQAVKLSTANAVNGTDHICLLYTSRCV